MCMIPEPPKYSGLKRLQDCGTLKVWYANNISGNDRGGPFIIIRNTYHNYIFSIDELRTSGKETQRRFYFDEAIESYKKYILPNKCPCKC